MVKYLENEERLNVMFKRQNDADNFDNLWLFFIFQENIVHFVDV